jgi:hypothetical protein
MAETSRSAAGLRNTAAAQAVLRFGFRISFEEGGARGGRGEKLEVLVVQAAVWWEFKGFSIGVCV